MAEKTTLKAEGLAFGHSLQTAFKTVVMYSVDHPSAEKATAQIYAALNKMVRQTQQFTFGFLNKRVLINDLLTDDNTLSQLEAEFFRRGISAITFSAGITLGEFKRGLAVLSTRPKVIEEKGGIQPFLQQNPLAGMRILPTTTPESEDTVLQMSPESYLMAQGILGPGAVAGGQGLESLLRYVGMEKPEGFAGGAKEAMELVSKATQAALMTPGADLRESMKGLVRMLEESTPAYFLSALPPEKQSELAGRSPEEVAQSLVEDLTVNLAAKRLADNPAASMMPAVQEQVVQILMRGLQATHVAERLLQKLSHMIEEAHLPPEVFDRIRQEIMWVQLSPQEKHAQLMRVARFDDQDFHRLLNYAQETMNAGKIQDVTEVVEHYLGFLDLPADEIRAHELSRVPQILPVVAGAATMPFLRGVVTRLSKELREEKRADWASHQQAANCLLTAAQTAALYEDFGTVHKIGLDLEASLANDGARHRNCCGRALENLLTTAAFERVIELYMAKRNDLAWAKVVSSLAKWLGPKSGEVVFKLLENENSASNRLRLVHMCAPLLGVAAMEAARRRLSDERWYVVRNACTVLGELGGPEITTQLRSALRHPDDRVQRAAVTSMMKCQGPGRAAAFAGALPHLKAQVLDIALDEIFYLKDPESVEGLQQFVLAKTGSRAGALEKAVRSLASIGSEQALEVLGKVLTDTGQAPFVRNAALLALGGNSLPSAKRILAEFIRHAPNDSLAIQGKKILASSEA
jgi:DNA-directed RNA polymerase subunit F